MALAPENSQLNVQTNHPIPGLRRMSITPTSRALRAQKLRKDRQTPVNQNPLFIEQAVGWVTNQTGNLTGGNDFGIVGQVEMTTTALGGIELLQPGVLIPTFPYRVEIEVKEIGLGPLLLINGDEELDFNVNEPGVFVLEFIAKTTDFVIALKLGLVRRLVLTAAKVIRNG